MAIHDFIRMGMSENWFGPPAPLYYTLKVAHYNVAVWF